MCAFPKAGVIGYELLRSKFGLSGRAASVLPLVSLSSSLFKFYYNEVMWICVGPCVIYKAFGDLESCPQVLFFEAISDTEI